MYLTNIHKKEIQMPNLMLNKGNRRVDHHKKVDVVIRNARLLGEFLSLGFKSFDSFSTIVKFYDVDFDNENGSAAMRAFWEIRLRQDSINDDFEKILDQLKNL